MNKLFKPLIVLVAMVFLVTACGPQVQEAPPLSPVMPESFMPLVAVSYDALLHKSLTDQSVADFVTRNACFSANRLQVCQPAGVALWMGADQNVESVFLYSGTADGFFAYKGKLPYGITFDDTMETVEKKLGHPVEVHALQSGWAYGIPDEGATPDHMHYQAIYNRFGFTVIYNSPSAYDKGATIYAIQITK